MGCHPMTPRDARDSLGRVRSMKRAKIMQVSYICSFCKRSVFFTPPSRKFDMDSCGRERCAEASALVSGFLIPADIAFRLVMEYGYDETWHVLWLSNHQGIEQSLDKEIEELGAS